MPGTQSTDLPWGSVWQGTAGALARRPESRSPESSPPTSNAGRPAATAVVSSASHLVDPDHMQPDRLDNEGNVQPGALAAPAGRVVSIEGPTGLGMTRIGLSLIAPFAERFPIAVVDVRGWICPLASWEAGVRPSRLTMVRCGDPLMWPQALAALLEGIGAVYAEVPRGVPDQVFRRLSALARSRGSALVLRPLHGTVPAGVSFLKLRPVDVAWSGSDAGHGHLRHRTITLEASGKGMSGTHQTMEMEDNGTNLVRVVSRMAPAPARRAAG